MTMSFLIGGAIGTVWGVLGMALAIGLWRDFVRETGNISFPDWIRYHPRLFFISVLFSVPCVIIGAGTYFLWAIWLDESGPDQDNERVEK